MSVSAGFLEPILGGILPWLYVESAFWTGIGLIGNGLFGSRFFIQWLHSERSKQLVVPPLFWHLSFWGSILQLLYGLHIDKLPIILGYAFLPIIYARNLHFLRHSKAKAANIGAGA
jgi:lipid-A-disaccharide synthase-like uncharacterized protein